MSDNAIPAKPGAAADWKPKRNFVQEE